MMLFWCCHVVVTWLRCCGRYVVAKVLLCCYVCVLLLSSCHVAIAIYKSSCIYDVRMVLLWCCHVVLAWLLCRRRGRCGVVM